MLDVAWDELDPRAARLAQARLALHHAVQLVAAVGQALAPRAEDDSQQSLTPDGCGAWLGVPVAGGTLRAAIDPLAFELWLAGGAGRPVASLPLAGRTLEDGLAFLTDELRQRGLAVALEVPRHPADFPAHALAGARFEAGDLPARQELARLFADTGRLLAALVGAAGSPLRLWPHHFDLACSLRVGDRSLGLGVSPGEGAEGRPYWYAAPWSVLPGESLPALAGGGSWHLEGWTGAELPIERLQGGAPAQRAQVGDFFRSAMAAAGWPATARAT